MTGKILGLSDPDPLVRGTDQDADPDPFISNQTETEKPSFPLFCDFFVSFYL
jgi:hypothetical protein